MSWLLSALLITIFFVVYAIAHSFLASLAVKEGVRRVFGPGCERGFRLVYNVIAFITLLPIFPMIALLPAGTLYIVPSPWRWLMVGGQVLALIGLAASLLQTGVLHFLGLAQLLARRTGESGSLNTGGFYAWMRHPLYTFSLLFLWLTPAMTTNLLTAYLLFSLYFYFGSIFEERRLLAEFGETYRDYQRRVPRFIPVRFPFKRMSDERQT